MTLQEAIDKVATYGHDPDWEVHDIHEDTPWDVREAIATILNAVVKGELTYEQR